FSSVGPGRSASGELAERVRPRTGHPLRGVRGGGRGLLDTIFVASLLSYEEMLEGEYVYPKWSINLGWALTASSLSCIPIYFFYKLYITKGTLWNRLVKIMKPEEYCCESRVISANYGTAGTHV
ncbi:unnamed protein product, partial [Nezara viridula]